MDLSRGLFEFLGVAWTVPLLLTAGGGLVGAAASIYKIVDLWSNREERRLALLHDYLDKEERDISAKRPAILKGIQLAHHSFVDDKNLDVGNELDEALALLDQGRPDRSEARLQELLKKIRSNSKLLSRRVEDLSKHERSVNIFLSALSERNDRTDAGLSFANDALASDANDLDALKYKGTLLLKRGELGPAESAFEKLKNRCNDEPTRALAHRADAYLGLGCVEEKRGVANYVEAERLLNLAISNLNKIVPAEQNMITKASVHQILARLYLHKDSPINDAEKAKGNYEQAFEALEQLPGDCRTTKDWKRQIGSALHKLDKENLNRQQPTLT